MVNKPDGKKSLPDMDMNHNPVWDVLDGKVIPEKKAKNKTKVKKKKPSEMDEEIDYYFSELEKEEQEEILEEEVSKRKISFSTWFYIISGILVVLITSLLLVIVLNYDKMTVSTNAMASQVVKSDQVMYKPDVDINRFNVVLVDNNGKEDLLRVIGMPGDRLEMKNDVLMINNAIYDEVYLKENYVDFKLQDNNLKEPYTTNFSVADISKAKKHNNFVPENQYILLGDNRGKASDSRTNGFYDKSAIKGIVVMKVWPLSDLGPIE